MFDDKGILNTDSKIVFSFIGYGVNNAVHLEYIKKYSGLSERAIYKAIEHLRTAGYCIVADNNGYYVPIKADEIERYIKRTEKRAKSLFSSLHSARIELEKMNNGVQLHFK